MLIIANWKLHQTAQSALDWLIDYDQLVEEQSQQAQIVVCPPFPLLPAMQQKLADLERKDIVLGAQNIAQVDEGAYTGEVGPQQLKGLVNYVIVGHSERRQHFDETNEEVNQKIELCLKYGLTPIICISNLDQVKALSQAVINHAPQLIIAFEPLFAISSGPVGRPDTPQHAEEMALAIKAILRQNTKVIYGGSVDEGNVARFLAQKDIKGALVGKASLDAKRFARIVRSVSH